MPQDKELTPGKRQAKGPKDRSEAARKAGVTRAANKTFRVVVDAIAKAEERLVAMITKSEEGIHGELASIRHELGEIGRSVKYIEEHFLAASERADLKRAAGGR